MLEFGLWLIVAMLGLFLASPFIIGALFVIEILADMLFNIKIRILYKRKD